MSLLHILVLALVQGVFEFLPISSSAHLVLVSKLGGFPDQGPLVDLALHLATLCSIFVCLWPEVRRVFRGLWLVLRGRFQEQDAKLALLLVLASVPGLAAGLGLYLMGGEGAHMRSLKVIAAGMAVFAVALYAADKFFPENKEIKDLGWGGALIIGLSQACAFIPGASRSGVTTTAGRFLGLTRTESIRFSLLLSVPLILAAGLAGTGELAMEADSAFLRDALLASFLTFLVGCATIKLLLRYLQKADMTVFVIYRLLLAGLLFALA